MLAYRRVPLWLLDWFMAIVIHPVSCKIGLAILCSIRRGSGPVGNVQEDGQ
jgi:hypothetical protein